MEHAAFVAHVRALVAAWEECRMKRRATVEAERALLDAAFQAWVLLGDVGHLKMEQDLGQSVAMVYQQLTAALEAYDLADRTT